MNLAPWDVAPEFALTRYEWQCRINTAMWAEGEYHKSETKKARRKGKK